jgi:TP901 family phage tail tape measure protein
MAEEIKVRIDLLTGEARREVKKFGTVVDRESKRTKSATDRSSKGFKGLGKSAMANLGPAGVAGLAAAAGAAFVAFTKRSIRVGSEFQKQLSDLSAITGITGQQLQELGSTAVRESVRTGVAAKDQVESLKLVASQLADAIDFDTQAGQKALRDIARDAVTLSKAAGIDLAQATNVATSAINQFGLSAEDSSRVINTLAAGSKFGAAEVGNIGAAMKEAGAGFAAAGQSIETANAGIQVLAKNAIVGSQAGTNLRNVITILQTETQKLADAGINDVNVKTDGFAATLGKLEPLLDDTTALTKIFGRENLTAAQILIKNASAVGEMEEKVTDTNVAIEQYNEQTNNLEGDTDKLTAAIDRASIFLFDNMEPALRATTQALTEAISQTVDFAEGIADIADQEGALSATVNTILGFVPGFQMAAKNAAMTASAVARSKKATEEQADASTKAAASQEKVASAAEQTTSNLNESSDSAYNFSDRLKEIKEEYDEIINKSGELTSADTNRLKALESEQRYLENIKRLREAGLSRADLPTATPANTKIDTGSLGESNDSLFGDEGDGERMTSQSYLDDLMRKEEEYTAVAKQNAQARQQARRQEWQQGIQAAAGAISNIVSLQQAQTAQRVSQIQRETDERLSSIDKALQNEKLSEEERMALIKRREEIEAQSEARVRKVKREQAQSEKRWLTAQAIANTAVAVTQALPNLVLAGIAAASGAIQIATIQKQPIPYRRGGMVPVKVSNGETYIPPAQAQANLPMLEQINSAALQPGRISGPGTGTSDSINALAEEGSFILNAKATSMMRGDRRRQSFREGGQVTGGRAVPNYQAQERDSSMDLSPLLAELQGLRGDINSLQIQTNLDLRELNIRLKKVDDLESQNRIAI